MVSGFAATGIHPFNPNAIPPEAYISAPIFGASTIQDASSLQTGFYCGMYLGLYWLLGLLIQEGGIYIFGFL